MSTVFQLVAEFNSWLAEVVALKRLQAGTAAELFTLLPTVLDRAYKEEL